MAAHVLEARHQAPAERPHAGLNRSVAKCQPPPIHIWPKACRHRSLGQRPRNAWQPGPFWPKAIFTPLGRNTLNMAFGQTTETASARCGPTRWLDTWSAQEEDWRNNAVREPSTDLASVGARLTATRDASRKTPPSRLSAAAGGGETGRGKREGRGEVAFRHPSTDARSVGATSSPGAAG